MFLRSLLGVLTAAALIIATLSSAHAQIAFRSAGLASPVTQITYVGAGAVTSRDNCGSISPAIPAGNVDDVLIAFVNVREDNAVVAAPVGWTELYSATYPGNKDLKAYIYYRIATGTDTLTVSQSGSCNSIAGNVSRFDNVDLAQPFLNVPIPSSNASFQNTNSVTTGAETTVNANAMLLVASFVNDKRSITAGVGWNASFENVLNIKRDLAFNLHYQLQTTAGVKSVSGWPLSGGAENIGIIFSLRPAPSGLRINKPAGTVANDIMIAAISVAYPPPTNPITHVGAGAATSRDNCGAISPAIPAGNNGDLLIALVNVREDNATVAASATWTPLYSSTYPGNKDLKVYMYYRFATGSDTLTVTQSGTCNSIAGAVSRFRNVDPASPFLNVPIPASNASFQNTNNVSTGTETTVDDTAMLLVASFVNDNKVLTSGASWSASFEYALNTSRKLALNLDYQLQSTAGARSISGWPLSGGAENIGIIFSLRPVTPIYPAPVTITPPSSLWTLVKRMDNASKNANSLVIYSKVATAAEPATYNWGVSAAVSVTGGIQSFIGVDTANPIDVENGQTTPSGLTHATPSVTTTVGGTMLVTTHAFASAATWTPPTDMAQGFTASSVATPNATGVSIQGDYVLQASAGPTGTKTATAANNADAGNAHILALRPALDHYSITVLSAMVANCDYAEVTITAHDAGHVAANAPAGRTVTLSVSAGAATAVWEPTLVAGTGGWIPGGATATYVWPGSESAFTVRLRQSAVISLNINANDTFVSEAGTEDPTISFVNSVFRISDGANAPRSVNTQIAGKRSDVGFGAQLLYLQAIRTDTVTGACTSLFPSGSEVDIGVGAQCNNPATCAQNVTLTTTAGTGSPTGSFVPAGVGSYPATIRFRFATANAEAPFYFSYADAGQITLQFRHVTAAPAVTISGISNAFIARPFAMYTQVPGNLGGNTPSGSVFTAAGTDFSATVKAVAWQSADDSDNDGIPDNGANLSDNAATPNFAYATSLVAGAPYEPSTGSLGVFNNGNLAAAAFAGGVASPLTLQYTEVGSFTLMTAVTDYLGDANADIAGLPVVVGRFTPHHFDATKNTPSFQAGCTAGAFSYIGQSFGFAAGQQPVATITAKNALGATTQNYTGSWRRLTNSSLTPGAQSGRYAAFSGSLDVSGLPAVGADPAIADLTGASLGSFTLTFSSTGGLKFTRAAPTAPFNADIGLSIGIVDADGIAYTSNPLTFGAATAGNGIAFTGGKQMRFGRLRIGNVFGTTRLDLPLQIQAQYYDTSGFRTNTDDSCTSFATSDIAMIFVAGLNLVACETAIAPNGPVTLSGGVAPAVLNLRLRAPGTGNDGAVDLRLNLLGASGTTCTAVGGTTSPATASSLDFLRGNWLGTGTYDQDPSARATFGIYKNANEFIYFQENF